MANIIDQTCPFCSQVFPRIDGITYIEEAVSVRPGNDVYKEVEGQKKSINVLGSGTNNIESIWLRFSFCPSCGESSLTANSAGGTLGQRTWALHPSADYNTYPDFIPKQIREDYEQACMIVNISPKASATLSRRCLQGIIRHYWKVTKNRLVDEINEIKNRIDPILWNAIDGLRRMGNIGAHMEKDINLIVDIDENEAELLISLIELIIKETYINDKERESLLLAVSGNAADKYLKQKEK